MRFAQAAHADKASTNEDAIFLNGNGANLGRLHWTWANDNWVDEENPSHLMSTGHVLRSTRINSISTDQARLLGGRRAYDTYEKRNYRCTTSRGISAGHADPASACMTSPALP